MSTAPARTLVRTVADDEPVSPSPCQQLLADFDRLRDEAGPVWQELLAPLSVSSPDEVAGALAERVREVAPRLPGRLQDMQVRAEDETSEYVRNDTPPPEWKCLHSFPTDASFEDEDGRIYTLSFQVPCASCTS